MLTGHHQYGVESMRMEGEYPGSVYDPEKCPFWPRVLRKHGYTTAQIGKWHTGIDSGYGRDWDHQMVWSRPKYPQNAGNYFDDQIIEVDGVKKRISGYTTDWYTDRAIDFIEGKIVTQNPLGICGFVMVLFTDRLLRRNVTARLIPMRRFQSQLIFTLNNLLEKVSPNM